MTQESKRVIMLIALAGISIGQVSGSRTSVHVGGLSQDYRLLYARDPETGEKYTATGTEASILSNRLSWFYNLKGPSMTVETACSSSLVALDLGCQALRMKEVDMVRVDTQDSSNMANTLFQELGCRLQPDSRSGFDHGTW
jgi:acyl transferase domain-containing protein